MERKLAVILYADVAGYSRLTGADEEGTHRTLSEYLDLFTAKVAEHGGRVVHFAGDAILAEFPSAAGAYDSATEVQLEFARRNEGVPADRKFQFRIGLNIGDVIVDRDDIFGDGVNVAARLETLAPPGGICVSETVHHQVRRRSQYGFASLGAQRVKNIADPVNAYTVMLNGTAGHLPDRPSPDRRRIFRVSAILLAVAILAGGGLWLSRSDGGDPVRTGVRLPPSVAVLPFRSIGENETQLEFSQGLTQDLITELSGKTDFRVIASRLPDAEDMTAMQIGKALQSRYVLDGSVRESKDVLRISALLVDTETGVNLWAGRFDRRIGNTLDTQVEVAGRIVGTLSEKLHDMAEEQKAPAAKQPPMMTSLLMRGFEYIGRVAEQAVMIPQDIYRLITEGASDERSG